MNDSFKLVRLFDYLDLLGTEIKNRGKVIIEIRAEDYDGFLHSVTCPMTVAYQVLGNMDVERGFGVRQGLDHVIFEFTAKKEV